MLPPGALCCDPPVASHPMNCCPSGCDILQAFLSPHYTSASQQVMLMGVLSQPLYSLVCARSSPSFRQHSRWGWRKQARIIVIHWRCCCLRFLRNPHVGRVAAEEDVSYTEEDTGGGGSGLPPLPKGIPPPVPPPEHLRRRTKAELASGYFDLLSEKGVRHSLVPKDYAA
jgi:hypothetical protein